MAESLIEINTENVLEMSKDIEELARGFNLSINQYSAKSKEIYNNQLLENQKQFNLGLNYIRKNVKKSEGEIQDQRKLAQAYFQIEKETQLQPPPAPPPVEEEGEEEEGPGLGTIFGAGAAVAVAAELLGMYAGGLEIGPPNDSDEQQTGLDMALPGGIGAPIYAPRDLIYKSKGTDGNSSVGLDGTPDVRGPEGKGFGYYASYYYVENGKTYEVLMGHLASMGYRGSKENEPIPKGTLLGYQGASGRTIGDGNQPFPHISLHINGVGFVANNGDLLKFASMLAGQSATTAQPPQQPKKNLSTPQSNGGSRPVISLINTPQKSQTVAMGNPQTSVLNSGRSGVPLEQILFATV